MPLDDRSNAITSPQREGDHTPSMYAPIIRYGAVVAAVVKNRGRLTFKYKALKPAVASVVSHEDAYLNAVTSFLVDQGWEIEKPGQSNKLARGRVNHRLGAIYDFDELLISRDTTRYVIRSCVTVCVDMRGELQDAKNLNCDYDDLSCYLPADDDSTFLYSKIWARISCVSHEGVNAAQLTIDQYRDFYKKGEILSAGLIASIKPTYEETLSKLVNTTPDAIETKIKLRISNFTVSTDDSGFDRLYDKTKFKRYHWTERNAVRTLDNHMQPAATSLNQFRRRLFGSKPPTNLSLMPVDNSGLTKSLYWVHKKDDLIRMIGLASDPFDTADLHVGEQLDYAWRGAPSNMMGVISTTKIANKL